MSVQNDPSIYFLEKELDYLHVSARSYDGKAQIASVAYLLTFGVLRLWLEIRPGGMQWPGTGRAILGLLIVVMPVVLFALVLVRRYRFAVAPLAGHRELPRTFTMSWFEGRSGPEIVQEAPTVDWAAELAFEIEKLRELRDRKRQRFLVALAFAALSVVMLLLTIALSAHGA